MFDANLVIAALQRFEINHFELSQLSREVFTAEQQLPPTMRELDTEFTLFRDAVFAELVSLRSYRLLVKQVVDRQARMSNIESVASLNGTEGGAWVVTTLHSAHILDFDDRTLARIPGPESPTQQDAGTFRLLALESCRVQEHGYWTLRAAADSSLEDFRWRTSFIQSITREDTPITDLTLVA